MCGMKEMSAVTIKKPTLKMLRREYYTSNNRVIIIGNLQL
jgi:hypothetical protein